MIDKRNEQKRVKRNCNYVERGFASLQLARADFIRNNYLRGATTCLN